MILTNIHEGLDVPPKCTDCQVVEGIYEYYHYGIDGINDQGWGCGYRTLQTAISWFVKTHRAQFSHVKVPTIADIQDILVNKAGDKEKGFLHSKEWIGCYEAFLVLDILLSVPCKLVHIRSGEDLRKNADVICEHFIKGRGPIMMGGDVDCSAKGIMGISKSADGKVYLLVADPHFTGKHYTKEILQNEGKVSWMSVDNFDKNSFYNLCLPIYSVT